MIIRRLNENFLSLLYTVAFKRKKKVPRDNNQSLLRLEYPSTKSDAEPSKSIFLNEYLSKPNLHSYLLAAIYIYVQIKYHTFI